MPNCLMQNLGIVTTMKEGHTWDGVDKSVGPHHDNVDAEVERV
jgi:hypothetical protein